ncbi:MAG TPA: sugar MFS transporter [Prolixibacteraceae bacterium]
MSKHSSAGTKSASSNLIPMVIISVLFFIFGFVTWLNGILIPYLKIACQLTNFQAMFVAFAFYIAYFVMGLPSSWVLKKTGFKNGMMVGLWVMALGSLIFIPAAMARTYGLFLTGLFVMGTGLTILQTAVNPYVTIIGPRESAAARISIMGICNKMAGVIAPLILAYYILNDGDTFVASLAQMDEAAKTIALNGLAHRVIGPYVVMTIIFFLLGVGVRYSPLPEIEAESDDEMETNGSAPKTSIWQYPHLVLGVLTLFFYVGAEVIAGDTIIRYGMSLGIEISKAKVFTSYTLISMTVAYILGIILIPKYLSQRTALQWCGILGIIFLMGAVFSSGLTSVFFIAILGFANALVWPAIWPLAIHNLGKFIKTGSAMMIMAILGGALLPLLWGKLSDIYGSQLAYLVVLPSYLLFIYYAKWGYKKKNW